jgi:site-specific DNA-methyltransferase (adenine-specific)
MIDEARGLEELGQVRDLAIAAAAYAKAHRLGREAVAYATEIALVAERRMAELDPPTERGGAPDRGSMSGPADIARQRRSENRDLLVFTEDEMKAEVRALKEPTRSRIHRKARYRKAQMAREEKAAVAVLPPSCDLRLGDFREVLEDVPDASVDLVLTDPPYPAEFLPLWSDLAVFAKRVLKPTGMLAAMSGQAHLPDVVSLLGEHMEYRWTMAYLMAGSANLVHARKVLTQWKPVLVYGSTERRLHDVVRSPGEDKEHHEWGQSEGGMIALIEALADPGQVVCDPFVGGGTTAVVALRHGCSFIGAEIDPEAHTTALARLAA